MSFILQLQFYLVLACESSTKGGILIIIIDYFKREILKLCRDTKTKVNVGTNVEKTRQRAVQLLRLASE